MPWNINLAEAIQLIPWVGVATDSQPKPGEKRPHGGEESRASKRQEKEEKRSAASSRHLQDQENAKEAPNRWKPDISPDDEEFTDTLATFDKWLNSEKDSENRTLDAILNLIFSPHERQLLTPANKQYKPTLAGIQKQNSQTYHALLDSRRFRAWTAENEPGIAFKLTLAYFGIPVEPIAADTWYELRGDVSDNDNEELPLVIPAKRNLRFANKYHTRLYGRDALRKTDRLLETYYAFDELEYSPSISRFDNLPKELPPPLGLRGGGGDSGADDDGDDENEDKAPLYGYQGKVWFRVSEFSTFVDAVDRLLGLDNRAGITYTLRMQDKEKYPDLWEQKTISCRGVGNFSADRPLWEWVVEALRDIKSWTDLILFVSGPTDPAPAHWEPTDSHRVLKFSLEWVDTPDENRNDVAYLRMPEKREVYANHYGPWMKQVCRVLAAGRIPGRPGRPAIPDAFISLSGKADIGTYGGLLFLPQVWSDIVKLGTLPLPREPVVLLAQGTPGPGDGAFLFMPGNGAPYDDLHSIPITLDDAEMRILGYVRRSMSPASFSKLKEIEVHIPGDGLLMASGAAPDLVIPVSAAAKNKASKGEESVTQRLADWKAFSEGFTEPNSPARTTGTGWQMCPQFISVHPIFSENTMAAENSNTTEWEPSKCTLEQFRRTVEKVCTGETAGHGRTSYITIEQGQGQADYRQRYLSKPQFHISPQMTEADWLFIRNCIVEPNVIVSMSDEDEKTPVFKYLKEEPFGYRDIYETEHKELYKELKKDEYPTTTHFCDFQVYGENASRAANLETIAPGGDNSLTSKEPNPVKPKPQPAKKPATAKNPANAKKPATQLPKKVTFAAQETVSYTPQTNVKVTLPDPKPQFLKDKSLTGLQKDVRLREFTYDHSIDVHTTNTVPIQSAPVDKILRVGGTNTPLVSQAVQTPSETNSLQKDFNAMRNITLDRNQACPYKGCGLVYPTAEPEQLEKHLSDVHSITPQVSKKTCPFCNVDISQWGHGQVASHLAAAHNGILAAKLKSVSPDPTNKQPTEYTPKEGEDKWLYCARCGRNHTVLKFHVDRKHHDSVCYRGAAKEYTDQGMPSWECCFACGERFPEGEKDNHKTHLAGKHKWGPYCIWCGLELGKCLVKYQGNHGLKCTGHGKKGDLVFCPWCGAEMYGSVEERMRHVDEDCDVRVYGAEEVVRPLWVVGEEEEGVVIRGREKKRKAGESPVKGRKKRKTGST